MRVVTRQEAKAAGTTRYFTGRACPRGHVAQRHVVNSTCVACSDERVTSWRQGNRQRYNLTERMRQRKPEAKRRSAEWLKRDRAQNPDKYRERVRAWYFENKDRSRELNAVWREENRATHNARSAERVARKVNATPNWLTDEHKHEIKTKYEESRKLTDLTGVAHHVDHIVPLKGENVCGLHVPWNLRVVPYYENVSKKNKLVEHLVNA